MNPLADYRAAEANLAAPDPGALARLPVRRQHILRAMAALHDGRRDVVLAAAKAARDAGEHDIGWLLEMLVVPKDRLPPGTKARDIPGTAEVPDILLAVKSWRSGGRPRGSEHLRRLAPERPALRALLETLASRRRIVLDGLAAISPRARVLTVAANVALYQSDVDLPTYVRQALPDATLDLSSYRNAHGPLADRPVLQRWLDDPQLSWDLPQSIAAASLAPKRLPAALGALLPALHRRLAAGQGPALLAPANTFAGLAHRADLPALAVHLDVLVRRLGALLAPARHFEPLLTLWRRNVGRPRHERLALAGRIADALMPMLHDHDDPPAELPFAIEAVVYLITHTEDAARRERLLSTFGWMLPEAVADDLLRAAPPEVRTFQTAMRALARGQLEQAIAAVPNLARIPGAGATTSKLLTEVFAIYTATDPPPRVARQLGRTLTELAAIEWSVDRDLLHPLLLTAEELAVAVAPTRALAHRELATPLPDGDPWIAHDILLRHHLGEEAEVQELVRRIGRWARRADPDTADDLVLRVLAVVHQALADEPTSNGLGPLIAPLSAFLLREGPGRPLRAARRANASSSKYVGGYAAWARAHRDRLDRDPFWTALLATADELAEQGEEDYDDDDPFAADPDIPF